MSSGTNIMENAYKLIEQGNTTDAYQLLSQIQPQEKENPDFWWLMIHASQNKNDGEKAVQQLLSLDPNYPGLLNIVDNLNNDKPEQLPKKRSRFLLFAVVLLVLLAFGFFFILPRLATVPNVSTPTPLAMSLDFTPTPEVLSGANQSVPLETVIPTEENAIVTPTLDNSVPVSEETSTPTVLVTASSETVTVTSTLEDSVRFLQGLLAPIGVPDGGIAIQDTVLSITVCSTVGIEASKSIRDIVTVLSTNLSAIQSNFLMVEIAIQNCSDAGEISRVVALPNEIIQQFAIGSINYAEVQQSIIPVR